MKNALLSGFLLLFAIAGTAVAGSYTYVSPADFKVWLETGKKVAIVDIQPADEFRQQHFRGALETNAFPVKSDADKQRLDARLPQLAASTEEVVIVCPRGGGGAKNTYDYLKGKGISEKRLVILKDGMQGWPYKGLTVLNK